MTIDDTGVPSASDDRRPLADRVKDLDGFVHELRGRLDRGVYANLGPVDLGETARLGDPELVLRILLADWDHVDDHSPEQRDDYRQAARRLTALAGPHALRQRLGAAPPGQVAGAPVQHLDWATMDDMLARDDRLLKTLQRLLGLRAVELHPVLTEASDLVAEALGADKVDVLLYDAASDSLVAMGTSDTPLGRRQHELGMNRLPLANGGPQVRVFQTGGPYLSGRADRDPEQLRGNVEGLGVRSNLDVPLDVDGERRGVLSAMSTTPDRFTERDLAFQTAVSGWIGMVVHRAELVEQLGTAAKQRGREEAAEEIARLSPREREVAVLLAEGLTNAEIARRLTLVEGTVANHVEHILRKLALRGRTQVATWAVQHGLYRLGDADRTG